MLEDWVSKLRQRGVAVTVHSADFPFGGTERRLKHRLVLKCMTDSVKDNGQRLNAAEMLLSEVNEYLARQNALKGRLKPIFLDYDNVPRSALHESYFHLVFPHSRREEAAALKALVERSN